MTLPDKLHHYDISLTRLNKLCSSNELELEIIKRYNNCPKLEEIKTLLENIIIELEQDITHKLQSIDSQHHQITDLESENKELKQSNKIIQEFKNESIEKVIRLHQENINLEGKYNKLRDTIKRVISDYNRTGLSSTLPHGISELQSILDSVENEK